MNCANILIVYFPDASSTETTEGRLLLKERYADRCVNMIKFSHESGGAACFVPEEPVSKQESGDTGTGIYVFHHGAGGFTGHLAEEPVRKAFANWLLSLTASLKIRKLCFITCMAVETSTLRGKAHKALSVSAKSGGKQGEIYVQQICHAISEIDTKKNLNGLMVAGYVTGVSVAKETRDSDQKKGITQNRIFKTQRRPDPLELAPEDQAELARFLQKRAQVLDSPIHPAQEQDQESKLFQWKKQGGYNVKIEDYVRRKRVFVWENGNWRVGKLSEYSDKDESWKEGWKKKLEEIEGKSGYFE